MMFEGGVTTRETATDLSGRGVVLAAVAAACQDAGGSHECVGEKGKGTTFRFLLPRGQTNAGVEGGNNRSA